MPVVWVPILPSEQAARAAENAEQELMETFITADDKTTAVNVISGVGITMLVILIGVLFAWAYGKDRALFIAVMGAVMFVFALNMLAYIVIIRSKMSKMAYNYYIGLTIFMTLMNLLIFVLFTTIYMRRRNAA